MATGTVVNQGKSAFLEKFLGSNGDANMEAVNRAWNAAGHEGTISPSLLKKFRSKMGLTSKRTEIARKPAGPVAKSKPARGARTKQASRPEGVQSRPKDSEGDRGSGKSAFVKEMLGQKPGANVKTVNDEWRAAGNQDRISDSIYYKVKRELGAGGRDTSSSPEKPKPGLASGGAEARTTGEARPESGVETLPFSPLSRSESVDRERVLDRVEDGIDDLMVELKQLGGMEEVLESLKKVRRIVVRSHQG